MGTGEDNCHDRTAFRSLAATVQEDHARLRTIEGRFEKDHVRIRELERHTDGIEHDLKATDAGMARAHKQIGKMDDELKASFKDRDAKHRALEAEVGEIKASLPNMQLASGWVFKAMLFIVGMSGLTSFCVIIWALNNGAHP